MSWRRWTLLVSTMPVMALALAVVPPSSSSAILPSMKNPTPPGWAKVAVPAQSYGNATQGTKLVWHVVPVSDAAKRALKDALDKAGRNQPASLVGFTVEDSGKYGSPLSAGCNLEETWISNSFFGKLAQDRFWCFNANTIYGGVITATEIHDYVTKGISTSCSTAEEALLSVIGGNCETASDKITQWYLIQGYGWQAWRGTDRGTYFIYDCPFEILLPLPVCSGHVWPPEILVDVYSNGTWAAEWGVWS